MKFNKKLTAIFSFFFIFAIGLSSLTPVNLKAEGIKSAALGASGRDVNILSIDKDKFTDSNPIRRKKHINNVIDKIDAGNKQAAENMKLKVENPGVIEGFVRFKHLPVKETIVYIENVNNNNFTDTVKKSDNNGYVTTKGANAAAKFPLTAHTLMNFYPKILPVVKGAFVDIPNIDTIRHNVFTPVKLPGADRKINLGVYDVGITKTIKIEKKGVLPLLCNVHKEMSAYIVSFDNPYYCLTDNNGKFRIENAPAGKYTLKTWHKTYKPTQIDVNVKAGRVVNVNLQATKEKK